MKAINKILLFFTVAQFCPVLQAACKDASVSTESLLNLDIKDLMDLDVRTASKKTESMAEAPAVMNVISCDEITRFGGNNLTEVLERATGLYFTGGPTFAQNTISLRGDSPASFSRHILLLFDGRPVREGQTGGTVSPFLLAFPLSMVERIEIVRDPGSVLYGSGAYVGVINVIPKRPSKEGTEGSIAGKGGSFNTEAGEGHLFWKKDDADLSIAANSFKEDGWNFKGSDNKKVYSQGNYSEDNVSVVAAGHYKGFKLDSFWLSSKQDTIGSLWPLDPTEHQWIYANLGYTQTWDERQRTEFNATLNQMNAELLIGGFLAPAVANSSLVEATHFFTGEKWQGLIGGTANVMLGHSETVNANDAVISQDMPEYENYWYTLYTQIDHELWQGLKLTLGGQAVKAGKIDWQFVPRGGITYHHQQGWGVKALYGEAYRAAYVNENGINLPNVFTGNPLLKPETIKTFDLQVFYQKRNYQVAATYYHSLEQNLIIGTLSNALVSPAVPASNTNGKQMTFQGLELEAKTKLFDERLLFTSSLTYQTSNFNGRLYTTTVPDWLGKVGLSYNFDLGMSMGLFHNFSSRPHSNEVINPKVLKLNPEAQPINLMTLKLSADLKKYTPLKLPIVLNFYTYNLLDDEVYLPEFSNALINTLSQRASRSFYFGMEYKFDL